MTGLINLDDYASAARERIPPGILDWLDGGAGDEITLRENAAAWQRYRLRFRVLRDVSAPDPSTSLLGVRAAMPAGIAPTAQHGLFHPDAELATARAAAAAGVPFVLSTMSSLTIEEVATAGGDLWFQLYVRQSSATPESLIERAESAGYRVLVLTVDAPILGLRERDVRAGETAPQFHHANLPPDHRMDASLDWRRFDELRAATKLPLVLKGIVTAEDAVLAVEHGCAGVWVSNHGGRQLDRSPAGVDVLEEIVRAVDGRAEVYVDGGVRRGVDMLIALALGAKAAFLGRAPLHGLAVAGKSGVRDILRILDAELRTDMALLGAPRVSDVVRTMVSGT